MFYQHNNIIMLVLYIQKRSSLFKGPYALCQPSLEKPPSFWPFWKLLLLLHFQKFKIFSLKKATPYPLTPKYDFHGGTVAATTR